MRVAHVNQDRGIAPRKAKGAAVHVVALRDAFARAGADVLAIDEHDDDIVRSVLEPRLASRAIDLVYERYALGKDLVSRLCESHGVPHVVEFNAPLVDEAALYRGGIPSARERDVERRVCEHATRVVCVSNALARHVAALRGRSEGVVVEHNAVGPEYLRPVEPVRGFTTPGRVVIGFHGRLRPWHAFERTVWLVRQLLAAGANVELAVVGEGDFDEHLAALPPARVVRVPWVAHEHVPTHVAAFDLVVLPYRADAPAWYSPLKLAEAMALGVVPVASDVGDLPHLVEHGVSGFVVPAASDGALFEATLALIEDAPLRARLAAGARARGRLRTWDDIAAPILALAARRGQLA